MVGSLRDGLGPTRGTANPLDGLRRLIEKKPDDGGVTGGRSGLGLLDPLADLIGVACSLGCFHSAEPTESGGANEGLLAGEGGQPWERLARESFPVTDLADDGDVGRHAQEARHQATEVHLLAVHASRPGLHMGDIREDERLLR